MVKKYSIWIEDLPNGKYKFNQKYADPLRSTADHIVLRTCKAARAESGLSSASGIRTRCGGHRQ